MQDHAMIKNELMNLGYITSIAGGMQIDIAVAPRYEGKTRVGEGTYCSGHRCKEGYKCPVPKKGVTKDFASATDIVAGINNIFDALLILRKHYLGAGLDDPASPFNKDMTSFGIDASYKDAIYEILVDGCKKGTADVNLIGGEGTEHSQIVDIITGVRKNPRLSVALTTTGCGLMTNETLANNILSSPLNVMALSADHPRLIDFCSYSLGELQEEYGKILKGSYKPSGQERKTLEAAGVAKMMQDQEKDKAIKTLFNVVVSSVNLKDGNIYDMIDTASKTFDNAVLNLYPGHQFNGPPVFNTKADAEAYGELVDYMIDKQKGQINDPVKKVVPRIAFWLSQKVPFEAKLAGEKLLDVLNNGIWSCIDAAEAGPYIQAGRDENSITLVPGLKPACLWTNAITTSSMQVHTAKPEQIAAYVIDLPSTAASCRCEMPRLEADGVRTQKGLAKNEKYNRIFTELRQEHLGF